MAHDIESEVGYRKPPKAFQFQKGRSGNPSGRPRNVPGIPELLWEIANQKVLILGKNGSKHITILKAILTQVANKGATGDLKAAKLLVEMLARFPASMKRENMEVMASSAKAKLLELFKARNDSHAEGAAEPDQPSCQASAIPHECDGSSSEESVRRQPKILSVGDHDSAGTPDHRPASNSTSQPPPAAPIPDGGRESPP
jgi:outer membrane protein OmpA-like peptidoglycan-associated protein